MTSSVVARLECKGITVDSIALMRDSIAFMSGSIRITRASFAAPAWLYCVHA